MVPSLTEGILAGSLAQVDRVQQKVNRRILEHPVRRHKVRVRVQRPVRFLRPFAVILCEAEHFVILIVLRGAKQGTQPSFLLVKRSTCYRLTCYM